MIFTQLGIDRNGIPLFHNHYDITIEYNQHDKLFQVLGAIVTPSSKNSFQNNKFNCDTTDTLSLKGATSNEVAFSYSVTWIPNTGNWATRWDVFLTIQNPSFHWYSLAYSIGIVLVLTGVLAAILFRILNRDIARYNQIDLQDDIQEDFGWKLVHGDVFRPPTHLMLLSVLTGSGLQLFGMLFTTLAFAGLGFFSPSYRGSFVTALVVLFMLFGVVSGFTSARLYKMFGGDNWKSNIIITATLVPGTLFTIFIVINFFLVATSSSASVPFGTIFSMILLWFLLSTPLSFVGSYYGLKKSKITHPVRTNQIPRQVPDQPLSMHPFASVMMAGILPFAAIYNELSFIMDSLWFHQIYYLFGFLFVIFLSLVFICSELTILLCYLHLCSENYHWWWRSFFVAGSTSIYIFLYSILYYFSRLDLKFTSTIIYFGWSFITSLLSFLITGSIGFILCLLFTRKIYGSIKID
ncbi:Transmembrane 9 super member 2 [Entomophthora muscae]|uniref:Transmembrane 9 super member 2 n=1 Tax=Entomophthora muscae TaxID=34485 RepID=A0ACC2T6X9_9FUNG|nr:Transmembrane 9 super member 2 [Entomophthora muscae]